MEGRSEDVEKDSSRGDDGRWRMVER